MEPISLSWNILLDNGLYLLAAFALALPIAWEREVETRIMGLRTLPLVAVACCAFILVGTTLVGDDARGHARLLSGLVAGIGFIGGGAILKNGGHVRGTATAASLLLTGVVGAAVGYGLFEIAILISALTLATLLVLPLIQRRIDPPEEPREED